MFNRNQTRFANPATNSAGSNVCIAESVSTLPQDFVLRTTPESFQLTSEQAIFIDALRQVRRGEMPRVFRNLEAPSLDEMNGEFNAVLLDQGHWIANRVVPMLFNLHGTWVRKGFQTISADQGRGYNVFRWRGRVCHRYVMQTFVDRSRLVRGQSFFLSYRPFNRGLIANLVGEVRRYVPGIYLGIGVLGPIFLGHYHRRFPFALLGPVPALSPESLAGPDSEPIGKLEIGR